jgi:hypothetical protein
MPETEVVLRHSDPSLEPWVVPVPEGVTVEEIVAAHASAGWSLDSDTLPADVPAPAVVPDPAVPTDVPATPEPTGPADAAPATPEGV